MSAENGGNGNGSRPEDEFACEDSSFCPVAERYRNVTAIRPIPAAFEEPETLEDVIRELREQKELLREQRELLREIGARLLDSEATSKRRHEAILQLLQEVLSR